MIEKLSFTQPEDTVHQTEISVQFKQLTTVDDAPMMFRGVVDEKTQTQLVSQVTKTNDQPNTDISVEAQALIDLANSGDKEAQKYVEKFNLKQATLKKAKNKGDNTSTRKK